MSDPTLALYDPAQAGQLDGSPLGGVSCTCLACRMATDRNTFGKVLLDWHRIRAETGDTEGGTTVQQNDDAIARLTGDDNLSTGYWGWKRIDHALGNGKGFVAAVRYTEIHRYGLEQINAGVPQERLVTGQEEPADPHGQESPARIPTDSDDQDDPWTQPARGDA